MSEEWSIGGEYEVVSPKIHWPEASIAAFLLTLPFDYGRARIWSYRTAMIVGVLCSLGLIAGLIGLRDRRRKGMARVGVAINGMFFLFLLLLKMIYSSY